MKKESTTAKKTGKTRKIAQSMKQAQAFWDIPVSLMKIAKAAGCSAFVEHRIHRDELLQWIKDNPEAGKEGDDGSTMEQLKRKELIAKVQLLQLKCAKEDGTSIAKEDARQDWARALSVIQEEARNLINDDDRYRIFCERIKHGVGNLIHDL